MRARREIDPERKPRDFWKRYWQKSAIGTMNKKPPWEKGRNMDKQCFWTFWNRIKGK
jgi:hypothetical protein